MEQGGKAESIGHREKLGGSREQGAWSREQGKGVEQEELTIDD